MLEEDQIVCPHCEKRIRYERPLFCPYCGGKLEPIEGLVDADTGKRIYPWADVGPLLIRLLGILLVLLLPVSWIFGRSGVTWLLVLFCVASIFFTLGSVFFHSSARRR